MMEQKIDSAMSKRKDPCRQMVLEEDPFVPEIMAIHLSKGFKQPMIEAYDGVIDSLDQLRLYAAPDAGPENDDVKLTSNNVTAWRARRYAMILLEGSDEHQFGLLRSFAAEILRTNPGSTCIVAIHARKVSRNICLFRSLQEGVLSRL
ncbi:hypothetical protein Adt_28441 [Abeliophyllum distichum]|uniref:Uncharacterized protein n=1 Tax=Abeliophyllum distichum TaxID=126358 RepID=A0ABD1RWJ4_9LAMI